MAVTILFIVGMLCLITMFLGDFLGYIGIFYLVIITFLLLSLAMGHFLVANDFSECTTYYDLFNWSELGNNFAITFGLEFTMQSLIVTQLILTASFFVSIFVSYDMFDEKEGISFISNICFFVFFMLLLVNSSSILTFYLGWEGIGLESFVLVSFFSERVRSIKATVKIFLINKIGDVLLLILFLFLWTEFQTTEITVINSTASKLLFKDVQLYTWTINLADLVAFILIFAASIKSAQFGFHIWLIEAMEAPMGASALMHSSTLVIAGVLLILKLQCIVILSPWALNFLIGLGVLTAISSTLIAIVTVEVKSVLANSTISNMGYLFILLGYMSFDNVYTVIIIHGYIKILLFIVAGLIINFFAGNQDVRHMGSIILHAPFIWFSCLLACCCLMGLPVTSGYYCKAAILHAVSISSFTYTHWGLVIFIACSYFFSFLYPVLLMYSIFGSNKQSHHSIYVVQKSNSFAIVFLVYVMSFIILFGGWFISLLFIFDTASIDYIGNDCFRISVKDVFFNSYIDIPYSTLWGLVYLCFVFYGFYATNDFFKDDTIGILVGNFYVTVVIFTFVYFFAATPDGGLLFLLFTFGFFIICISLTE